MPPPNPPAPPPAGPPPPPAGPPADELSEQIKLIQQLTLAMLELTKVQQLSGNVTSAQRDGMSEVGSSFKDLDAALEKATKTGENWRDGIKRQIGEIESFSDATNLAGKALKLLAKENKTLGSALAFGAGAAKGLSATFSFLKAAATGIFGVITSIAGAVLDLGAAILSAPFKMLEGLIGMAKEGMGSTELAQAGENVREVFGDLSKNAGKSVMDLGRSLTQGMIGPGLSAIRVFGTLAESIEYANKVASVAPVLFTSMRGEFEKNGKAILAMAKGLGIADEDFAGLLSSAKATGQTIESVEVDIAKYAKGLSAEFGLNSKLMSRDIGRAMKDVKHFANSTVKEIAKATAYAHGLGLELKDITGVLDAFNTFDQASENVSKLSQAFGVNLDAMKLLEAKTPDDALKMVKDSFNSAGKSVENMNRHELQLLASSIGMTEENVRQSLSSKNLGISHNKVATSAQALERQTLSTSDAISSMTEDIVRAVKAGPTPESNTLWGMFFDGFLSGIARTKEMRSLLDNLRKDMYLVTGIGRELGASFVESFPGFKEILEGLADVLAPSKIGGLFSSFKNTFTQFFKDLREGTGTVKGLMAALQGNFTDYLTKAGPEGQKLLHGIQDFWAAAKAIIVSGINYLGDLMKNAFEGIADMIEGKYSSKIGNIAGGIGKEVSPIADAFGGLFEKIKGPLGRILDKFFDFIGDKISEFWKKHWFKILAVTIGPSIVSGLASVAAARFAQGPLVKALSSLTGAVSANPGAVPPPTPPAPGVPPPAPPAPGAPPPPLPGVPGAMKGLGMQAAGATIDAAASIAVFAAKAKIAVEAMKGLMDAIKKANLTPEKFDQVMKIVEAMMSFYSKTQIIEGTISVVNRLASALPHNGPANARSEANAFARVAGTIIMMLVAAEGLILMSKQSIDINKLTAVGNMIEPISNMFLKAAAISVAAKVIGAISAATGGASSAALAIGLTSIGATVAAIIAGAEIMISAADKIKSDGAQFKAKAEGLVTILDSVIKMIIAMRKITASIPNNIKPNDEVLTSLKSVIKTLTKGIVGIIDSLKAFVENVKPDQIPGLTAVASVISAVGSIISGIGSAIAALSSTKAEHHFFAGVDRKTSILKPETLTAASAFISSITTPVSTMITTITSLFTQVPADRVKSVAELSTGLGSIMSAVGSIFSSIAGAAAAFKTDTSVESGALGGMVSAKVATAAIDTVALNAFVDSLVLKMPLIMGSMEKLLKTALTGEVLDLAGKLTPEKIAGMKEIINLISAIASIINAIASSASAKDVQFSSSDAATHDVAMSGGKTIKKTINHISVILPDMALTFKAISENIGPMITKVLQAAKDVNLSDKDIKSLSAVGPVFTSISVLVETMMKLIPIMTAGKFEIAAIATAKLGDTGNKIKSNDIHIDKVSEYFKGSLESVALMFEAIAYAGEDSESVLQRIVKAVSRFPSIPPQVLTKIKDFKTLVTDLSATNKEIDSILGPSVEELAKQTSLESDQRKAYTEVFANREIVPLAASDYLGHGGDPKFNAQNQAIDKAARDAQASHQATADQAAHAAGRVAADNVSTIASATTNSLTPKMPVRMDVAGGVFGHPELSYDSRQPSTTKWAALTTKINELTAPDSGLDGLVTAASRVQTTLKAADIATISAGAKSTTAFFTAAKELDAALNERPADYVAPIAASFIANKVKSLTKSAEQAMLDFNATLNGLKGIDTGNTLKVVMGPMLNALGVKDATYNIVKGGVTMAVKIDISMDGKMLEKTMTGNMDSVIVKAFAGAVGADRVSATTTSGVGVTAAPPPAAGTTPLVQK